MTGLRVLIVEDNPIVACDLADELESRGITSLHIAGSLREALRAIGRKLPDVAIVDLNLRDGYTGAQLARALASSGVKVCILSGQSFPDDILMGINHTFIAKPAPASIIAEIVQAHALVIGMNVTPPEQTFGASSRVTPGMYSGWVH
jgi:two-component system, response regulator PdtaR